MLQWIRKRLGIGGKTADSFPVVDLDVIRREHANSLVEHAYKSAEETTDFFYNNSAEGVRVVVFKNLTTSILYESLFKAKGYTTSRSYRYLNYAVSVYLFNDYVEPIPF